MIVFISFTLFLKYKHNTHMHSLRLSQCLGISQPEVPLVFSRSGFNATQPLALSDKHVSRDPQQPFKSKTNLGSN